VLIAAAPAIIRCLAETDNPTLQYHAAQALGALKAAPKLAVPALTNYLNSTNAFTRLTAVCALADFGAMGHSAWPALLGALHDPDTSVRKEVTNALLRIAPEALTNAPAQ